MANPDDSSPISSERFQTTHWSMVLAAGKTDTDDSRDAMTVLCQRYWLPVYTFIRRSGHQTADAQDLTQAFFVRMIEKRFVKSADENRGRFRTFLLATLKNFVANEWKKSTRQKRGAGVVMSLDFSDVESRLMLESTAIPAAA